MFGRLGGLFGRGHAGEPGVVTDWLIFAKAWVESPLAVGAAAPSSRLLGERMATHAVPDGWAGEQIVELGPGTGVITDALLKRGVPAERLICVERSPVLARTAETRFPAVRVLCADAAELAELVGDVEVDCVVSGLPLRSLPTPTVNRVVEGVRGVLRGNGRFVQFTYDLRGGSFEPLRGFEKVRSEIVWRNVPPARVETFRVGDLVGSGASQRCP